MTTINLRKDLEALYYFGTEQFDPQRNVLRDQSGYGRHTTASGGPSVGVNGPNDFEATSFDGTDDKFTLDNTLDYSGPRTTAILYKSRTTDTSNYSDVVGVSGGGGGGNGYRFRRGRDLKFKYVFQTANVGTKVSATIDAPVNEWTLVVGMWDGDKIVLQNEDDMSSTSVSGHTTGSENEFYIANTREQMDIALVARWFRTLSDTEIQHLNRLTAPRRATL